MTERKWVAGVDGAQRGWIVAYVPLRKGKGSYLKRYEHFSEVKAETEAMNCQAVAVDMPMGLSDEPNNKIDQELRKRLGERRSSLFPTPSSGVLNARTYEEALERNREITGKGISIQAWNLVPQIRQVRKVVHPSDTGLDTVSIGKAIVFLHIICYPLTCILYHYKIKCYYK